jgi:glycosyltransferase involved in cell wall biosynthesis
MKIIVAVPDITFHGGAEQVAQDIGAALLGMGDVVIVSAFSHASKQGASNALDRRKEGLLDVVHLGLRRPRSVLGKVFTRLTLMRSLRRAIPDADIVIGNNFFRYFALPLSRRVICVEVQHLCYEEERPRPLHLMLRNALYRWLDNIVVLTERDRMEFARHGVKNTSVLYNAVHVPGTVRDATARSKVVVAVGRLTAQKNFATLIEVWATVAHRLRNWSLVIYGEGEERDSLQALIDDKRLAGCVSLAGFHEDKHAIYESGALLCSVSRYEGFGLSLYEAAAHGLPVVAFDCPTGPRELLSMGELGRLVPLDDRAGLRDALIEMAEDGELRERCARNARQVARAFSFDAFAERWRQHVEWLTHSAVERNRSVVVRPLSGLSDE